MKTIEEIRKAFQRVHLKAIGVDDHGYMSIPADPRRDADLIVSAAIDELEQLRKQVEHDLPLLRVVLDAVLQDGGASPLLEKVAEELGLKMGPDHIFAEYEYGFAPSGKHDSGNVGGGHITVTGTSLCGLELKYGGHWSAQTQNEVEKELRAGVSLDRYCPKCVAAWPSRAQYCGLLDHSASATSGACVLRPGHEGPCTTTPQMPRR